MKKYKNDWFSFHPNLSLQDIMDEINTNHPEWGIIQIDRKEGFTNVIYRTEIKSVRKVDAKNIKYKELLEKAQIIINNNPIQSRIEGATFDDAVSWLAVIKALKTI